MSKKGKKKKGKKKVEKPFKEGYMTKEGKIRKNWKKRWFKYFTDESGKKEKGVIELKDVEVRKITYKRKAYCFLISSKVVDRKYYISCSSEEEMDIWTRAIMFCSIHIDSKGFCEKEVNIIVAGMSCTGKSSLLRRWASGYFALSDPYMPTKRKTVIKVKTRTEDGVICYINFHDLPHLKMSIEEVPYSIIKDSKAVLIVFDVTQPESFRKASYWLKQFNEQYPSLYLAMIGNKIDLPKERMVKRIIGHIEAVKYGARYFETTSVSGLGDLSFGFIVDDLCRIGVISSKITPKKSERKMSLLGKRMKKQIRFVSIGDKVGTEGKKGAEMRPKEKDEEGGDSGSDKENEDGDVEDSEEEVESSSKKSKKVKGKKEKKGKKKSKKEKKTKKSSPPTKKKEKKKKKKSSSSSKKKESRRKKKKKKGEEEEEKDEKDEDEEEESDD